MAIGAFLGHPLKMGGAGRSGVMFAMPVRPG